MSIWDDAGNNEDTGNGWGGSDSSEAEDAASETEGQTTQETVDTTSDATPAPPPDDDGKVKKSAKKPLRKKRDSIANVSAEDLHKLFDIIDLLKGDERAVAVARLMTGSRKSDPFELASELTNGQKAARVKNFADMADKLGSASNMMLGIELTLLFTSRRDGVQDVFDLLNAVAPERGFGKVARPERAKYSEYAESIISKWGDGVDMSVVSLLRV